MSLQENTLGNTTILHLVFDNVDSVIIQVIIDYAFSDSIVFVGVFNYGLLEVSLELEDLFMKMVRVNIIN